MTSKITITIATQKSRKSSLMETIDSIERQTIRPDELRLYANDYELNCNAGIYKSFDHPAGDLADNGKFYEAEKIIGYHLTMDDDIIYPADYIQKCIQIIDAHKRSAVIGFHGVILKPIPINHYYQDRKILRCLEELPRNEYVHILGTGAFAYHSDTFRIGLSDFHSKYMADIHFGIAAQKKEIPMLCVAHEKGWIKQTSQSAENMTCSIYAKFRRNDKEQTQRVNELKWKINQPT